MEGSSCWIIGLSSSAELVSRRPERLKVARGDSLPDATICRQRHSYLSPFRFGSSFRLLSLTPSQAASSFTKPSSTRPALE